MKTISLAVLMAVLSVSVKGQAFIQMGAGSSFPSPTFAAEVHAGGIIKNRLMVSAGMQAMPTNSVKTGGAIFQGRIGYALPVTERLVFTPFSGYGAFVRSTDNKAVNERGMIYGADLTYLSPVPQLSLYLSGSHIQGTTIASFGVKFYFVNYSGVSCR
jgi:hypothetical protein